MLKPLHDHVVLEVIKQETTTKSGIVLQQEDTDQIPMGTVLAVGPGRYTNGTLEPLSVSVGDKVLYKKYATQEITLEGNDFLIVKESDIYAVVEEGDHE